MLPEGRCSACVLSVNGGAQLMGGISDRTTSGVKPVMRMTSSAEVPAISMRQAASSAPVKSHGKMDS